MIWQYKLPKNPCFMISYCQKSIFPKGFTLGIWQFIYPSGFDSINSEDAAELCVMNSFHIAIILSANNYYDKEQKRFQYFWNWTLSPNNPMYFFKLRLLQCGEDLNRLNMTPMEETFLSVITFLSTGEFIY